MTPIDEVQRLVNKAKVTGLPLYATQDHYATAFKVLVSKQSRIIRGNILTHVELWLLDGMKSFNKKFYLPLSYDWYDNYWAMYQAKMRSKHGKRT